MPVKLGALPEAVLEEAGHQRLGVRQRDDAVAEVAGRQDAELAAEAAGAAAVVGDGHDGRDVGGVVLEAAQHRREAGPAADGDDLGAALALPVGDEGIDEADAVLLLGQRGGQAAIQLHDGQRGDAGAGQHEDQAAQPSRHELERDVRGLHRQRHGAVQLDEQVRQPEGQDDQADQRQPEPALDAQAGHEQLHQTHAVVTNRPASQRVNGGQWASRSPLFEVPIHDCRTDSNGQRADKRPCEAPRPGLPLRTRLRGEPEHHGVDDEREQAERDEVERDRSRAAGRDGRAHSAGQARWRRSRPSSHDSILTTCQSGGANCWSAHCHQQDGAGAHREANQKLEHVCCLGTERGGGGDVESTGTEGRGARVRHPFIVGPIFAVVYSQAAVSQRFCTRSDRAGRASPSSLRALPDQMMRRGVPAGMRGAEDENVRGVPCGKSSSDEDPARSRRAFRASDAALGSEDAAVHLHRAQRHPHHRSPADRAPPRRRDDLGPRVRGERRHDHVRRHQEAGPGDDRGRGAPLRHAVRQPPLDGRHADELPDDHQPNQAARTARSRCATMATSIASRRRRGSS